MHRRAATACLNEGPDRTQTSIMVRLRPAAAADALPILEWQRHPDSRRYARDPTVPSEAEHLDWFARKLASPDCEFLIAEQDGQRVGFLRLDRHGEEWEVSIVVAPDFRSSGVGRAMLNSLVRGSRHLVAEVLPGNQRSHELFCSCGWRLSGDGRYRPGS